MTRLWIRSPSSYHYKAMNSVDRIHTITRLWIRSDRSHIMTRLWIRSPNSYHYRAMKSANPTTNLSSVCDKFHMCLQRADDELCFHISGPSIAQILAKLSSQIGRLKPLHRRWSTPWIKKVMIQSEAPTCVSSFRYFFQIGNPASPIES